MADVAVPSQTPAGLPGQADQILSPALQNAPPSQGNSLFAQVANNPFFSAVTNDLSLALFISLIRCQGTWSCWARRYTYICPERFAPGCVPPQAPSFSRCGG